jgi:hypothetical protein
MHKYRRYIFVWNVGTTRIVATERGRIALRSAIFVYRLGKDGKTAALIDKRIGFTNNLCGAATKLADKKKVAVLFVSSARPIGWLSRENIKTKRRFDIMRRSNFEGAFRPRFN